MGPKFKTSPELAFELSKLFSRIKQLAAFDQNRVIENQFLASHMLGEAMLPMMVLNYMARSAQSEQDESQDGFLRYITSLAKDAAKEGQRMMTKVRQSPAE